ncbi:PQQ-binding-like beta-propeller repeat protein [Inediibacterium massiliense]|uniref:outer membrane protein assembly factor BamB family protein n=1 Tax=Inediibacterium massiliense TaxID=1658111 RepID=UPI0006B4E605|nr:PQQ-binding-like beta-propeller repeat protein [Inediibacterium massiliense]
MRKTVKKLLIYTMILCMIVGVYTPFSFAQENEGITFEWERTFHTGYFDDLRYDEIPSIHKDGSVYVNVTSGYLFSVAPDRTMDWKINLFQRGEADKIGGVSPVFDEKGNAYIASGDKKVYCISKNGNIIWTYLMKDEVAIGTSTVLKGDTIYAVTLGGTLYAIDKNTGKKQWDAPIKQNWSCNTPVVASDGTIFVGSTKKINAIHKDGSLKWHIRLDDETIYHGSWSGTNEKRMAVGEDDNLYVITFKGNNHYKLHKFSGENGKDLWNIDIYKGASAPAVYKDTVYYKTQDNVLHAVDTKSGKEKWIYTAEGEEYEIGRGDTRPPAIGVEGTIYVPMGKNIYAINPDGTKKAQSKGGEYFIHTLSKPGLNGEIYGGGEEGRLLKFVDHTIEQIPKDIHIKDDDFAMIKGGEYILSIDLKDTYNRPMSLNHLEYESNNEEVIKVENGKVEALKEGKATIKVFDADHDLSDAVNIEVLKDSSQVKIEVSPKNAKVIEGRNIFLIASINTKSGMKIKGEKLEWISRTLPIVNVDEGRVEAIQPGEGIIRVRLKNYPQLTEEAKITVKNVEVQKATDRDIKNAIIKTIGYYNRKETYDDWEMFAINAAGTQNEQMKRSLQELENKIKEKGVGSFMTDYERTTIAILSGGGDPTNLGGINLIDKIVNWPNLSQGINAPIWGLIALDAANGEIPAGSIHTRDSLIDYILTHMSGEGWAFGGGSVADPDMTGMALYALAPYKERPDVKLAGQRAIKWLSENQLETGEFGSWGTECSESISQVIMGLTAWGIDPQSPEFTKKKGNAVTALLNYQVENGMFKHTDIADPNFGTPQGLQALAALNEYMEKGYSTIFYKIDTAKEANVEVESIEIAPKSIEIENGKSIYLTVKNQDGAYISKDQILWSVSDPSIAEVEDGKLITKKEGTVNVKAVFKDQKEINAIAEVVVVKQDFEVDQIDVQKNEDKAIFSFDIKNISDKRKEAVCIIGLYDKNTQKIIYQSFVSKGLVPNEKHTVQTSFVIPKDGEYEIKAMIWNDWLKGRALVEAIVKEIK